MSGHLNTLNAPAWNSTYILHLSSMMGSLIPSTLWGIHLQLYIFRIFFLWWACSGYCCCLVKKLCLTFCDSMDCSTLGFNCLSLSPGFAQTDTHWVQWCQLMISSSLPALNLSQHQDLFQWTSSLHQVLDQVLHQVSSIGASASASVLPMNIQSWVLLRLTGLISLLCKGLSALLSSTTIL